MRGESRKLNSSNTPNSVSISDRAPASTAMAMM